ncbi:MAG TPA: alcohol dehydrogenase catalytic domain-containing protein [Candidatus Hydrogenedens sp.]|nr:alcohol dehydrogenase catalytic domain-containing protein [Candidatus Hydrogenedens sp.]HOL19688.1 alcohol dehydrogenase catalytic domain-containing protein [Candidatus Hydrogenedens sp.]HPP59696.1 alcohol dehydrogenase catalytic domain-containing protein [Candidatus Hydrogenedens sp.]
MKCACWLGPKNIQIIEKPKPIPKDGEALVQVESVGICGSDIHYYVEGKIGDQHISPPLVLGHEFAGNVIEVKGSQFEHLVGKRVAVEPGIPCGECEFCNKGHYNVCPFMKFLGGPGCDGALSEFISVPARMCFSVPDTMSAPISAMVEPTAVALHAVELACFHPGETALVVGLGSIGLLTVQLLLLSGASLVAGIDLNLYRSAIAIQLGAHKSLTPISSEPTQESIDWCNKITEHHGFDVTFDCTNSSEGIVIACHGAKPAGRCVLVGISGKDYDPIPVSIARRRELKLQWCRRFRYNFPSTIELIRQGKIKIEPILTHHFPPEQTSLAFDMVASGAGKLIKASIDWI